MESSPRRTVENTNPHLNVSTSPSPSTPLTPSRLWRPAAQRNIRNQMSVLRAAKDEWTAAAAGGRAAATALVNDHLSQSYLPSMELGVLKDMPGVREKAIQKLAHKQEMHCQAIVLSFKKMLNAVSRMVMAARSLRCFCKGSAGNSLVQFCDNPELENDRGDGGGIPVFSLFSVAYFETLALELAEMFVLELHLKRLLVVELLSTSCKENIDGQTDRISWTNELYPGEFHDLRMCNFPSPEHGYPKLKGILSTNDLPRHPDISPNREVLKVYLTTWISDLNIETLRVEEIFTLVEEEMQIKIT